MLAQFSGLSRLPPNDIAVKSRVSWNQGSVNRTQLSFQWIILNVLCLILRDQARVIENIKSGKPQKHRGATLLANTAWEDNASLDRKKEKKKKKT